MLPDDDKIVPNKQVRNFDTLVIHPKGHAKFEKGTGAIIPSISLSTTFAQFEPSKPVGVPFFIIL